MSENVNHILTVEQQLRVVALDRALNMHGRGASAETDEVVVRSANAYADFLINNSDRDGARES